jgi:hypothetical protein
MPCSMQSAEENVNRRFKVTNDMDMAKFYDETCPSKPSALQR